MFEPTQYYLFGHAELQDSFAGWETLESRYHNFDAPGQTVKMFTTVVANKPGGRSHNVRSNSRMSAEESLSASYQEHTRVEQLS